MPSCKKSVSTSVKNDGTTVSGCVTLSADGISFFNRIKLFDSANGQRILPVHYSDNYITLMPGDTKTIAFDFPAEKLKGELQIRVEGFK